MVLYPNVRLIHLNPGNHDEIAKERLCDDMPAAADALARFAADEQHTYDLLHSHYWLSGIAGEILQRRWHCPHLIMFHTLGLIKNRTTAGEAEPALRITYERRLADAAHGVVAPTDGERKNLIDHYGAQPETVYTIPCGVNLDRFKPMDRERARMRLNLDADLDVVLFVGRFAPLKGMAFLLNATAELLSRFPRLRLLLAGGDGRHADASKTLADQIAAISIGDHVDLVGRVAQGDLPIYYNAADLVAQPSTYESFGLVNLEALACGTPVATTATGAAAALIKEGLNGTIIEEPSGAAVARGIERLLNQKRQGVPAAHRIRATVEDFGWDRVAESILETYDHLINQH